MTDSIWHKAGFHEAIDNKLKSSKDGKWIYWTMYGWNIAGEDVHDIGVDWAYLEDIIAQADKAERLEKENEAMREEFEVWHGNHKCVLEDLEIARKALREIRYGKSAEFDLPAQTPWEIIAEKALEQITHDNSEKANSVEHKE